MLDSLANQGCTCSHSHCCPCRCPELCRAAIPPSVPREGPGWAAGTHPEHPLWLQALPEDQDHQEADGHRQAEDQHSASSHFPWRGKCRRLKDWRMPDSNPRLSSCHTDPVPGQGLLCSLSSLQRGRFSWVIMEHTPGKSRAGASPDHLHKSLRGRFLQGRDFPQRRHQPGDATRE